MKNVFVSSLLVAVTCLSISSCNKDDDSDASTSIEKGLIGKWDFYRVTEEGALVLYVHAEGCDKDYVEFVDGGEIRVTNHEEENCEIDMNTGTWTVNDNKLSVKMKFDGENEETETYDVETLNKTDLKISFPRDGYNEVMEFKRK